MSTSKLGLTPADFHNAAQIIGCDVSAIMAVDSVESHDSGFFKDGRLAILFEPHVFYAQLKKVGINPIPLMKGNEDILRASWVPGMYGPYSIQWDKLLRAKGINITAALMSCSWGRFQTMGYNFRACGYNSVTEMVDKYNESEAEQLAGFCRYIMANHLDDELRAKEWEAFAELYNGPAWRKNDYANKLNTAEKQARASI